MIRINWWGVAFVCCSIVLYQAGHMDGRQAQIRESMPTKDQVETANEKYIEDVLKTCKTVWEETK